MKTIIAGSRTILDLKAVEQAVRESGFTITEVVSGCSKGVDTLGEIWANNKKVPVKRFPAKWEELGRKAGPLRNLEMAAYADALIAVWDGTSRGTKHMIDHAQHLNVFVWLTS